MFKCLQISKILYSTLFLKLWITIRIRVSDKSESRLSSRCFWILYYFCQVALFTGFSSLFIFLLMYWGVFWRGNIPFIRNPGNFSSDFFVVLFKVCRLFDNVFTIGGMTMVFKFLLSFEIRYNTWKWMWRISTGNRQEIFSINKNTASLQDSERSLRSWLFNVPKEVFLNALNKS